MVDITGLSKPEVLKVLYDHSHVQGMGFLQMVDNFDVDDANLLIFEARLTGSLYFDYVFGRVLKVDISGDSFDQRLYDRDCGIGMAQKAIDELKKSKED